ncbi:venom carboxylesterase-6-like [Sitophilus oryzae]|uniref:Carboxylic ester hydrolase n=1 Tax=Sitophilus oryzae TaxID=7048 RepID=A0A6J2YUV4_SITOR|nr:venom carboxylesterase-6-like [Sitophilus oryzae]
MVFKCLIVFVLFVVGHISAENLTIQIADGQVKGVETWSIAGNTYYAFYSIRYAKAPTGILRFQAPVPVDPWTDVYDATYEKNICYQVNVDSSDEDEDCLTLSVYTPINPLNDDNEKYPVMVYIHGGGFYWGSGQTKSYTGGIGPGYLMDSKVVMVSINYRLGPFGFFSTGDTVIPGNAGLKDQTLALKWVQNNIAYFGGDTSKVTIFGESAGGASVAYQLLSASSKGLYTAAILESGTALCPWAFQRNQTEITYKTASFIDSQFDENRDSQQLLSYLQTVDAKAIDDASRNYTDWAEPYVEPGVTGILNGQLQQGFFYAPVVEVVHDGAFLITNPYEAFASGSFNQVPILIGTCSEEGLMSYDTHLQYTLSMYDLDHALLVPQGMHVADDQTKSKIGDEIKNIYSPNGDMQDNLLSGIQYYTDQNFQKSLISHAELQSQYTDVYFYIFSYSGDMGGNSDHRYPGSGNVTHTEEGNYIFERNNPKNFPVDDQLVHERIVRLWVNFAYYKNPTPSEDSILQNVTWPLVTESNFQYLDIGENVQILKDPKKEKYSFWKDLYETYGVRPYETY